MRMTSITGQMIGRMNKMEDRCICCGDIIPEGRQVCPNCEESVKIKNKEKDKNGNNKRSSR